MVGETPVVDTSSSMTENTLSQDMLFNLPIRPSNAATELLDYLPGINNGAAFGGDSDTANALLLDGVDTRDPSGGSAWTFFAFNLVDEVQVSGLGAPAEYGAFRGRWSTPSPSPAPTASAGLFEAYYTTGSLAGDNVSDEVVQANPALGEASQDRQVPRPHRPARGTDRPGQAVLLLQRDLLQRERRSPGPAHLPRGVEPALRHQAHLAARSQRQRLGHPPVRQLLHPRPGRRGRVSSPPTRSRTTRTPRAGTGAPPGVTSSAPAPSARSATRAGRASTTSTRSRGRRARSPATSTPPPASTSIPRAGSTTATAGGTRSTPRSRISPRPSASTI